MKEIPPQNSQRSCLLSAKIWKLKSIGCVVQRWKLQISVVIGALGLTNEGLDKVTIRILGNINKEIIETFPSKG